MTKWLSVRLRTKWFWVRVQLQSLQKNGKLSFLDIEVSPEGNKFTITVYHKPTLSGVYTYFDSFCLLQTNLA